eukprot:694388-Amphidinium_carterae.1
MYFDTSWCEWGRRVTSFAGGATVVACSSSHVGCGCLTLWHGGLRALSRLLAAAVVAWSPRRRLSYVDPQSPLN